ncbi:PASTA domain-containing protein, partial [Bacillaceae bacterium Marseille-Q3522]|nr:PASTA domain-containing protein [Bacillaceae bacterium Marseille-Q3522]
YKVTGNSEPIRDYNRVGWGTISFLEGVQHSSNVLFAKLVNEYIGFDMYREYLTKFGFENPTGIELPNEVGGQIVYQYPRDKAATGFGQATAITPIQQIQGAIAIANDGKMLRPHVVDKIVDSNTEETIEDIEPEVTGTPISAETAKKVRDILETVISSPNGTGYGKFNIEGYKVAGKTGTAQIPGGTGYLEGANNHVYSFIGMVPKDDPQLVMYVAVQQPEVNSQVSGSLPVSTIFKTVMKNSLQYLNIKPDAQIQPEIKEVSDVTGFSASEAANTLQESGLQPVLLGNGDNVVKHIPENGEKILPGEKIILLTDGSVTMPNLTGWSLRDVMKLAELVQIKVQVEGQGYVVSQSIPEGNVLNAGDTLQVNLQSYGGQIQEDTDQENSDQENTEQQNEEAEGT